MRLPNGKIAEFPDGMSPEDIDSALRSADQRLLVEERGFTRAAADVGVDFVAGVAQMPAGLIDMAQVDKVPEAVTLRGKARQLMGDTVADTLGAAFDASPVGDFEKRAIRAAESAGGALQSIGTTVEQAAKAAPVAIEQSLAATGLPGAGLIGRYADKIGGAIRSVGEFVSGDIEKARAEENAARVAAGRKTLEEETQAQIASRISNWAGEKIDEASDALKSDYAKAVSIEMGKALDGGVESTAQFIAENPGETLSAVLGGTAAYLLPGLGAARLAKAAGAGTKAATTAAVQGTSGLISQQGAEEARDLAMGMSEEQLWSVPDYAEARNERGLSHEQAQLEVARRAYDAALGAGLAINAATGAAAQRLGLTPVEEMLAKGGRLGPSRIRSAVAGGLKETPGEALQGFGETVSQNLGGIAAGTRDPADALEGASANALLEGIAGAGLGAATGAVMPEVVAADLTSRPTDRTRPDLQGAEDVRAIYEAARAGAFSGSEPAAPLDPAAGAGQQPGAQQAQPKLDPAPAAPTRTLMAEPAMPGQPADDLEAQLQAAGLEPVIAPGPGAAGAAAAKAWAAKQAQAQPAAQAATESPAPSSAARGGEMPVQDPGATGQAATPGQGGRLPRALQGGARKLVRADTTEVPPPAQTGYAAGVRRIEPGEDAKPYLKQNIDTLPMPTPEQLPADSSLRYFSADKADLVVPMSALKPSKVEEPGSAAIKRMAATAAGVIARRDAIDVKDNGDGTYTILDGNGSYAAAAKIGLADMPVRIVEAPEGAEPWRLDRGLLTDEQNAQLLATYEKANEALPDYTTTMESLAEALGGEAVVAPLKGRTRAEQKIAIDYGGDVSQIKDLLRGTMKFKTPAQAIKAANSIRARFQTVKDKDALSPGAPDKGFGYRDINMVIRMPNGTLAEVQLMTEAMAKAKSEAHKHYVVTRALEERFKSGTFTEADREAYAAAEAAMIKAYGEAADLDNAAMNSARETGDQESGLRQSTASTPSTGMALPDGENLTPLAGGPSSVTNANTSPSLRSMNTVRPPAGGMVTPSNTSATGDSPSSADGPIVSPENRPKLRALQALQKALGIGDAFEFANSPADIFTEEEIEALGIDEFTEGLYLDGKVYLFGDAIIDPARAIWVFAHEWSGHHGLAKLLGPQYRPTMALSAQNPLVKAIADDIRREAEAQAEEGQRGARSSADPSLFVEEALAELAAAYATGDWAALESRYPSAVGVPRTTAKPLLKRVAAAIKSWFAKATPEAKAFTDDDVIALLQNAFKAARQDARGETPAQDGASRGLQSRAQKQKRQLIGDRTDVTTLPDGPNVTVSTVSMADAVKIAGSRVWKKGRDLKLAIQAESRRRQREQGIDLSEMTRASHRILVQSVVDEARDAIVKFANAIGWYDKKTAQALSTIALVHPEIKTDTRSRIAFIWALAVTSNGTKVNKNFELANLAYSRWKESSTDPASRVMPSDIGIGTAKSAMNEGLALFNNVSSKMPPEVIERMLVTRFTVGEIAGAIGIKPSGEAVTTPVRGASILGPKIGNGFLSNLLGYFDQLTMDRWFMRTWGRLIGKLVEVDQDVVDQKRRHLAVTVASLSAKERATLEAVVGSISTKTDEETDGLSDRIKAATADKEVREASFSTPGLSNVRKAGNALVNARDGSIEAPSGPEQREYIRSVFGEALEILQESHPGLTMVDLQAVLWYPEKTLYEMAKEADEKRNSKGEQDEEGYADDEAPDYANAARDLALSLGVPMTDIERAMRDYTPSSETSPREMSEQEKADFLRQYIAPPEQGNDVVFEVAPDPNNAEAMSDWEALDAKTKLEITRKIGAEVVEKLAFAIGIKPGAVKKPVAATGGFAGEINSNQIASFSPKKVSFDQALALASAIGEALDQASVVVVDARAEASNSAIRVKVNGRMEPIAGKVWDAITTAIPELAGEGFTARGDSLEFLHFGGTDNAEMASRVQSALDGFGAEFSVSFGTINSAYIERGSYAGYLEGLRPAVRRKLNPLIEQLRADSKRRIAEAAAAARAAAESRNDRAGAARRGARRGNAGAPASLQSQAGADGQPGVRRDDAGEDRAVPARQGLQSRSFPKDAPVFRQRKQQPDAVSVKAIHYSGVEGLSALDGKFAGSGSAGAERRRFGYGQYGADVKAGETARRLYFYVQDGDAPPKKEDVVTGENRYAVTLANLYDVEADPRGFREEAGMNPDYLEELINEAGFDGAVYPPLPGIDGRIAILHGLKKKVPVVSAPLQSRSDTLAARRTAAELRQRKSQLASMLESLSAKNEQLKSWSDRARRLIGEVATSRDFALEIAEARRAMTDARREVLRKNVAAGIERKAALAEYDNARDMLQLAISGQSAVRAKAVEANRLLDKIERRDDGLTTQEREQIISQLGDALDQAERAYLAAKAVADFRAKNDYRIAKAFKKRDDALSYLASEGYSQGSMLWNEGDLLKKKDSLRRKLRRLLQDKFIDLRDVQDQIEEEAGRVLDESMDVYTLENQSHGKIAEAIEAFRRKHVEPLKEAIKSSGMDAAEVERYLWAKHAPERNAKIRAIRPGVDDGSGMTDEQSAEILAGYTPEQTKKLEAIGKMVEEIRRYTLATLLSAGQIDQKTHDQILASYDHYVPLRGKDGEGEERIGGTGRGISAGPSGIQRALGRKTPPKNILAELVGDSERAIVQAGKAEVGRALLRLALSYPNDAIWKVEPVELRPEFNEATGEVFLNISRDYSDSIIVKHNGKPYRVAIMHKELREALSNSAAGDGPTVALIVKYFGAINRALSAVFTRFSPLFVPINFARDMTQGLIGTWAELGGSSTRKIMGYYGQAASGMWRAVDKGLGDSSVPDAEKRPEDWAREAAEAGMKSGWTALEDMDTLQQDIEDSMKSVRQIVKEGRPMAALGAAVERSKAFQKMENVNDVVENGLRLATYIHLRKDKGWSKQKAASYAKEMTVNFNRKGTAGSFINALYLFYNASIQGSVRTLRLLRQSAVMKAMGGMVGAQFMLAATLGSMKPDDDDEYGMTLWEMIPQHVKDKSFVVPLGFTSDGGPRYLSIPMQFGINIFPSVGGWLANATNPNWRAGRSVESMAGDFVGYVTSQIIKSLSPMPVGVEDGALTPTLFGIASDLRSNTDGLGRPIYPEDMSNRDAPKAGQMRADTTWPYPQIALMLNRLGGGSDYTKPTILPTVTDVSPNEIEYLVKQFTGGPGNFLNQALKAVSIGSAGEEVLAGDIPIVRSFVGSQRAESAQVRAFYENRNRLRAGIEQMRDAFKRGGPEEMFQVQARLGAQLDGVSLDYYRRDGKNGAAGELKVDPVSGAPIFDYAEGSFAAEMNKADNALSEINRYIRAIYNDRNLSMAERQKLIMEAQREKGRIVEGLNRAANYLRREGG